MSVRCWLLMFLAVTLVGCASSTTTSARGSGDRDSAPADVSERAPGTSLIDRLVANDNGVALRRWSVVDDAIAIQSVLAEYGDSEWDPAVDADRARANGFRMGRVPIERVDEFAAAFDGTSTDVSAWYGQVYDWSELAAVPVGRSGRAVAIDGRVRPFRKAGEFQLMFRCWTAAMEEGPRLYLEIAPRFQRRAEGRFDRILGQRGETEIFEPLLMTLEMDPAYAYMLTTAPPSESWDGTEATEEQVPGSIGPAVSGPPTIGEMLLFRDAHPRTRGMLVFVPMLPDSAMAGTASATARESSSP